MYILDIPKVAQEKARKIEQNIKEKLGYGFFITYYIYYFFVSHFRSQPLFFCVEIWSSYIQNTLKLQFNIVLAKCFFGSDQSESYLLVPSLSSVESNYVGPSKNCVFECHEKNFQTYSLHHLRQTKMCLDFEKILVKLFVIFQTC